MRGRVEEIGKWLGAFDGVCGLSVSGLYLFCV